MARLVRPLVVALAAAGLLALPTAGTAGAEPTGEPVKVMIIFEKSAGVPNPEIPDGAVAAAEAFNKEDGIGGRPVEVIECDTENNPNTAADCGRQAVEEGVVALIGNLTVQSLTFLPLMAENKIPSIGVVPALGEFTSPAAFPITGGAPTTFAALPRFLADDGAEKISMAAIELAVDSSERYGNEGLEPTGQTLNNVVPVPIDAPDMSTYVTAALANDTDAIVVALPGQQAINFVQAAKQANPDVKLALISTEPGPVLDALGDEAEGVIQAPATYTPSMTTKAAKKATKPFVKQMKAAGFDETSGFRLNSWISMQILADMAEGLPEVTAAAVFDKLNTTTDLKTGLMPPLQWTEGGVAGLERIFNGCEMAVKLTAKGKLKPVTGKFFDPFADADCPNP
jgi:ABC-type branched-subunit amino acid transport system substrate-binding protein